MKTLFNITGLLILFGTRLLAVDTQAPQLTSMDEGAAQLAIRQHLSGEPAICRRNQNLRPLRFRESIIQTYGINLKP